MKTTFDGLSDKYEELNIKEDNSKRIKKSKIKYKFLNEEHTTTAKDVRNIKRKKIDLIKITSLNNNHIHKYIIDSDGNGETSYNNGHVHKIINFEVQEEHKHIHNIKGNLNGSK